MAGKGLGPSPVEELGDIAIYKDWHKSGIS